MPGESNAAASVFTGTERILAFSDGVFAIAITLLVLNLQPPHVDHGLLARLREDWPSYFSYALSFLVIGIIWAQHHQMFTQIKRSNHVFLLINIFFLMWVSALPFPAALLAEYLDPKKDPAARHTAMAVYAGMFVLGSFLFNLLWWYAIYKGRLLSPQTDHAAVRRTTRSYYLGPISYLADLLLALISVEASLALFLILALYYALAPLPGTERTIARLRRSGRS